MTINRAELFRLAWVWAKQDLWSLRLPASHLWRLFRDALVRAWADIKRQAAYRAAQAQAFAAVRLTSAIRADLMAFECKDSLRGSDWQHLDALRAELRFAEQAAA